MVGHLAGRRPARQLDGTGEIRAALTKIGTNLNQVTRALNVATLGGPDVNVRDVLAVVATAKKVMAEVRDALRERA